ncbi:MAG: hypothetical protein M0Z37_06085 [Nitrospiraceae bacterium]|nr:hypothetical protein [Nitrospiraceae bacterium]
MGEGIEKHRIIVCPCPLIGGFETFPLGLFLLVDAVVRRGILPAAMKTLPVRGGIVLRFAHVPGVVLVR